MDSISGQAELIAQNLLTREGVFTAHYKKISIFPSPAGMSLAKFSLAGNY
jgi:hypothetical protein